MSELSCLHGSEGYKARDDAPGLPKVPASERIDIDENGKITGLFCYIITAALSFCRPVQLLLYGPIDIKKQASSAKAVEACFLFLFTSGQISQAAGFLWSQNKF